MIGTARGRIAAALCAAALAFGGAAGSLPAQDLVVYSGRGERFTEPVLQAFRAKTGIATQALVGEATALLTRIEEEGPRTQADVFLSNYSGLLELARTKGLLQPYRSPMAANIPPEFHGIDDTWIAGSARVRAIVYNTKLADPARLKHMMDLADPRWQGKLGITVSSNASFIGGLAAMIHQEGAAQARRFLEGIRRNAGNHVYPSHTPVISAVARGEVAVGLVNQYYFYRAIAQNPELPLGIVYPDQDTHGSVVATTGLAILKYAKHPEAARKFIDFVLSDEGQKIFAEVNYEFPVNPRVERHPLLPKPGELRFSPVSQALQTGAIDQAVALIQEAGLQ